MWWTQVLVSVTYLSFVETKWDVIFLLGYPIFRHFEGKVGRNDGNKSLEYGRIAWQSIQSNCAYGFGGQWSWRFLFDRSMCRRFCTLIYQCGNLILLLPLTGTRLPVGRSWFGPRIGLQIGRCLGWASVLWRHRQFDRFRVENKSDVGMRLPEIGHRHWRSSAAHIEKIEISGWVDSKFSAVLCF